jgi:surfeit locus 1 family protein
MHFRPFPVLTLLAIPALALLISLGVWQLPRAEWKKTQIEKFEVALKAAPLTLNGAVCGEDAAAGRVVSARDVDQHIDLLHSIRMFGQSPNGQAGWRLFSAASPSACSDTGVVLAELGFEPMMQQMSPAEPPAGKRDYLLTAWPPRGMFTLDNDAADNDWHWFDAAALAAYLGVPKVDDRFYLAVLPDALPANLARTPPETHYGYAITWFGMAIVFVVIYAVFHARAGRLRFGKRA